MKTLNSILGFLENLVRNISPQYATRFHEWRSKNRRRPFDSACYWRNRYRQGGDSGPGSLGKLGQYKADFVNQFVEQHKITTVIEFGCGDGNQVSLANYPNYLGFDISEDAIMLCQRRFLQDSTKKFKLICDYSAETAELALSLDVVYHLVEDSAFSDYMVRLFQAACRYVIIYSSNFEPPTHDAFPHVRHRRFTDWISVNKPNWHLIQHIPNPYPYCGDLNQGSGADFFVYSQASTGEKCVK